jgi:hypothetical protein
MTTRDEALALFKLMGWTIIPPKKSPHMPSIEAINLFPPRGWHTANSDRWHWLREPNEPFDAVAFWERALRAARDGLEACDSRCSLINNRETGLWTCREVLEK